LERSLHCRTNLIRRLDVDTVGSVSARNRGVINAVRLTFTPESATERRVLLFLERTHCRSSDLRC
jgi:hypothetical protein